MESIELADRLDLGVVERMESRMKSDFWPKQLEEWSYLWEEQV